MEKIKILDLFSGIGGFSYAAEQLVGGYKTEAFCEIDPFCQKVLKKNFPNVPIYDDVRKLKDDTTRLRGINIVCGGFPCQPFSTASENGTFKRKGTEDDRFLWGEMFEIAQKVRADWIIGENVNGLINMGLDQILSQLEDNNYTTRVFCIPATAAGANHQRNRLWIVANSNSSYRSREGISGRVEKAELFDHINFRPREYEFTTWKGEARVYREHDGLSRGMDSIRRKRLKALGNSIVPQVVARIFEGIKVIYEQTNV
jgi:DNA (cytosine-5)-methyltransferase 1